MSIFAILLAAASTTPAPECTDAQTAIQAVAKARDRSTPLGLVLGTGGDWGAKYLVVKTTHQLAIPGIPTQSGESSATYYAIGRERACSKPLEPATCPQLSLELAAYRSRSYVVMQNRDGLRKGAAYHPPFAILVGEDGDGTVMRIATQSEHPLMHDASDTFRQLERCTTDVDAIIGGL